jgi:hypothetical protein
MLCNMCKSTVDWCEENYVISDYIAEFWNAISGLSILISTLYFYIGKNAQIKDTKYMMYFQNINLKLTLVSIGTILFHSTLLYKYQLLDEIPMIWVTVEYIKLISKLDTTKLIINKLYLSSINFAVIMCLPMTCLIPFAYKINANLQKISFISVFLVYTSIFIGMMIKLSCNLNKCMYMEINKCNINNHNENISSMINKIDNSRHKIFKETQIKLKTYIEERKLMNVYIKRSVILGILSVSCWITERIMCENVNNLHLHAWWHVLMSICIYKINMIILQYIKINRIIEDKKCNKQN